MKCFIQTTIVLIVLANSVMGSFALAEKLPEVKEPKEMLEENVEISERYVEAKQAEPRSVAILEEEETKKVPFMKTLPRFEGQELPPQPVLVMDDGRAMDLPRGYGRILVST